MHTFVKIRYNSNTNRQTKIDSNDVVVWIKNTSHRYLYLNALSPVSDTLWRD